MKQSLIWITCLGILFFSCGDEDDNFGMSNDDESEIACENKLSLSSDTKVAIDFDGKGQAYLYKSSCEAFNSNPPEYAYNYLVVDMEWETFGWPPRFCDVLDGVPGIIFGSIDEPMAGDVLEPYFGGPDALYQTIDPSVRYSLGNTLITIEENGTEIGQSIGGTITGLITAQNDENDSAEITARFCVPIVSVSE